MGSRFVRPDTKTLTISNGDTLTVRRRLTAGEARARFARMSRDGVAGRLHVNPIQVGLATIVAYLLDWSFTHDDGSRVDIRGLPADELAAVLDTLDPDDFSEILTAIEAHEAAIDAERAAEKNGADGESKSSAISPSPDSLAGATNG